MTGPAVPAAQPAAPDAQPVRRVKRLPRWGQRAALVLSVLVGLLILQVLLRNPRFQWGVVREYLFSEEILQGVMITLYLTVVAMGVGVVIGMVLALMRLSESRVLRSWAGLYVWIFRGTPPLIQLIFLYNISALFPQFTLAIPFGPVLWQGNANALVTPLVAAIVALGLNESAYMCEIIKAGVLSVPRGQTEAARALGMSELRIVRRIILPQAMVFVIPPTANEVIKMLKMTSLVSVIAIGDLLYSAQLIYTRDFTTIPLLMVAVLWYLLATSVLTLVQMGLERHYGRG